MLPMPRAGPVEYNIIIHKLGVYAPVAFFWSTLIMALHFKSRRFWFHSQILLAKFYIHKVLNFKPSLYTCKKRLNHILNHYDILRHKSNKRSCALLVSILYSTGDICPAKSGYLLRCVR